MSKKKQGQLKHVFLERQKKSEQHVFKKSRKKMLNTWENNIAGTNIAQHSK